MTANELIKDIQGITWQLSSGDIIICRNGVPMNVQVELKQNYVGTYYLNLVDKE